MLLMYKVLAFRIKLPTTFIIPARNFSSQKVRVSNLRLIEPVTDCILHCPWTWYDYHFPKSDLACEKADCEWRNIVLWPAWRSSWKYWRKFREFLCRRSATDLIVSLIYDFSTKPPLVDRRVRRRLLNFNNVCDLFARGECVYHQFKTKSIYLLNRGCRSQFFVSRYTQIRVTNNREMIEIPARIRANVSLHIIHVSIYMQNARWVLARQNIKELCWF